MTRSRTGAALLLGLLLAGCGGGGPVPEQLAAPAATLPSTPTGPESASVAASPPPGTPSPAPAQGGTPEPALDPGFSTTLGPEEARVAAREVEQTVRDYYAAVNRAQYDGDIAGLEALSIPECNCRGVAEVIRTSREQGQIQGAAWHLDELSLQNVHEERASIRTVVRADDGHVLGPDGTVVLVIENGGGGSFIHAMVRTAGGWRIAQVIEI